MKINYVSLGDSIAAGHTINSSWESNYGTGSQYGSGNNTQTAIVPGCYTDLIATELRNSYGSGNVSVKSFAHSGDRIDDLMNKLNQQAVISAIQAADIITVCIGANDVLEPAMSKLEDYINAGDSALDAIAATVNTNLNNLSNDSYAYSFTALFNRLNAINPNATYIFTTIYNPYKYLWIDESSNGFFKPILDLVPQMNIDVDGAIEDMFNIDDLGYLDFSTIWNPKWVSIELNYDLDEAIKSGLLSTYPVQLLFDRVNGLGDWAENHVSRLNAILTSKIAAYGKPNFKCIDTKAEFEKYPDRNVSAEHHYNDLVSVEFTRGYNTATMDWGALWGNKSPAQYWTDLAWKYLSFSNALPSWNVNDYVSFDINGMAAELVQDIVNKVIVPDVDPHPEEFGHKVMQQTFTANLHNKRGLRNVLFE